MLRRVPEQQLARAKQHSSGLLRGGLQWDRSHGRAQGSLRAQFG
jgi:hypothetical protein